MMDSPTARRISAIAPIVMSLVSLAVVIEGHFEFGSSPPTDEGWQAHIFQLMMVFQLPIIVLFVVASWRSLQRSLPVIGAQAFL